jgi:hypothetical protein
LLEFVDKMNDDGDNDVVITKEIITAPFGVKQIFPELEDAEIADIFGDTVYQPAVNVPLYSELNEYRDRSYFFHVLPLLCSVEGRRPWTNDASLRAFMKLLTYHNRIDEFSSPR